MLGKLLKYDKILQIILLVVILVFIVMDYNKRCNITENWIKTVPHIPEDIGPPYHDIYYKELAEGKWANNDDKTKSSYDKRSGDNIGQLLKKMGEEKTT